MNGWIQHHVSRLRRTGNPNWDWAFHGEPQTSYMYYRNGTAKVQHILHFEALDEEFDQLMKVGLSLSLYIYPLCTSSDFFFDEISTPVINVPSAGDKVSMPCV